MQLGVRSKPGSPQCICLSPWHETFAARASSAWTVNPELGPAAGGRQ